MEFEPNTLQALAYRMVEQRIQLYQRAYGNRQHSDTRTEGRYVYDRLREDYPHISLAYLRTIVETWRKRNPKKKTTKQTIVVKTKKPPRPPPPPPTGRFTALSIR